MDILNVRPAEPGDVGKIWELLAAYAHERLLLARPQEDIQEKLKNFLDNQFFWIYTLIIKIF